MTVETCQLCGSSHSLTFHHLIPRTCHKNKWFKKQFSLEEMRTRGLTLCRKCHSFIHKKFSEKELGRELNELEKLLEQDLVINYLKWAKKQNRQQAIHSAAEKQ